MSKIKNNDVLLYISGRPIPIPQCNIVMHQPTIKQIAAFGEEEFLIASQTLANVSSIIAPLRQSGNSELEAYSDFQLLLAVAINDEDLKKALTVFFNLVFPDYVLDITENDIQFSLKNDESKNIIGMLNPFNFDSFSKVVQNLFCMARDDEELELNPANERAAAIAEKIKAGRKKLKEIKSRESDIGSMYANYVSVLSIGLGMDINILLGYTPFQLLDAFNRYWAKVSNDIFQKLSTTPLMDTSKLEKPKEWSRNLYS